jgi:cytoplasmic tRNA 2-thiolation protein 1
MPSCNKCQKAQSIYYRAHSGEYLCKKCFLRSIEDKTARTISKYSMIGYGDNVAVGVSGGKDSLSLLYVLKLLFDQHPNNGNELIAVTIDEGIEGYRDESLQIVKDFCAQLRVENKVLSYKSLFGIDMDEAMILRSSSSSSQKMSSCSICGTFRRRAIDIAAETVGADIIVTAHNMDDQLQTFMINLLAGDVERIGWIYPEPVQYSRTGMKKVKPFIEIYEYEIAFYALQREIPFQSEECPYMNESIRTDLREFFNRLERDHPGIKYNAYNSVMKVSKILRSMPSSSESKKCWVCGRVSTGDVCSTCKTLGFLTSNKQI